MRLSVSISLRNLYNSLNSSSQKKVHFRSEHRSSSIHREPYANLIVHPLSVYLTIIVERSGTEQYKLHRIRNVTGAWHRNKAYSFTTFEEKFLVKVLTAYNNKADEH